MKYTVNVLTRVHCSLRTSATVVSRWKPSLDLGKCLCALTLCCLTVKENISERQLALEKLKEN